LNQTIVKSPSHCVPILFAGQKYFSQYYEVFKQWDDPHQLPRYNTKQEPVVKA